MGTGEKIAMLQERIEELELENEELREKIAAYDAEIDKMDDGTDDEENQINPADFQFSQYEISKSTQDKLAQMARENYGVMREMLAREKANRGPTGCDDPTCCYKGEEGPHGDGGLHPNIWQAIRQLETRMDGIEAMINEDRLAIVNNASKAELDAIVTTIGNEICQLTTDLAEHESRECVHYRPGD